MPAVSLLVPSVALPAEGAEFDWPANFKTDGGDDTWLPVFRSLCAESSPRFHVRKSGVDLLSDIESASVLHWVRLGFAEDDGAPQLEASPATTSIEWASVMQGAAERMNDEHFIATPQEMIRAFLDEARSAVRSAAHGFAGQAVPLVSLSVNPDESVTIAFHGVWQADADALKSMNGSLPVRSFDGSDPAALDACLVLDEAEAEGRLLAEAVVSLSLLAMVFQQPLQTTPPEMVNPPPLTALTAVERPPQVDLAVSQPLKVKSQKLRQPAPLIYPNVIANAEGCEHKVVVDIGGQRAYVFIDNLLAFETPISSASKGRHTPRGTFKVTEKIRSGKRSTLYHSLMPYWMRLDQSAIGMHTGQLPGYPASHGCVRMPDESAKFIFDLIPRGTIVQVVDSLKPKVVEPAPTILASK